MTIWTPTTINRLRELWAEGHSTAQIGRMMDLSKNMVIGKAHRLKLEKRPDPIVRKEKVVRIVGAVTIRHPETQAPNVTVSSIDIPRTRQCQWLEGERPDFVQCRQGAITGKSWCSAHYHRVFNTARRDYAQPDAYAAPGGI
jgi:GcrA cell cycle regulator